MTEEMHNMILTAVQANTTKLTDVVERLARLEEREKMRAVFYGTCGGLLPSIGTLIWWVLQ